MFSRIFIERPRFAMVISIVLTLAGAIAVFSLPITLYPEITPPTIRVSATYPGASAEVIANTVGIPLEETINGVEGRTRTCGLVVPNHARYQLRNTS